MPFEIICSHLDSACLRVPSTLCQLGKNNKATQFQCEISETRMSKPRSGRCG